MWLGKSELLFITDICNTRPEWVKIFQENIICGKLLIVPFLVGHYVLQLKLIRNYKFSHCEQWTLSETISTQHLTGNLICHLLVCSTIEFYKLNWQLPAAPKPTYCSVINYVKSGIDHFTVWGSWRVTLTYGCWFITIKITTFGEIILKL